MTPGSQPLEGLLSMRWQRSQLLISWRMQLLLGGFQPRVHLFGRQTDTPCVT
jgi:hypothetical protein